MVRDRKHELLDELDKLSAEDSGVRRGDESDVSEL